MATKPAEEFVSRKKGQIWHRACRLCRAKLAAKYTAVAHRRPETRKRIREYDRTYYALHGHRGPKQAATRDWILSLKDAPCMDCGGRFPPEAMDFDHRDATQKAFPISSAMVQSRPREVIEAELAKCDLVCANCHRVREKRRSDARRAERRARLLRTAAAR